MVMEGAAMQTIQPPGPEGRFPVGNLLQYARDPLGFLTRCSRRYGDVVRLRIPSLPPVFLVSNPDFIEQVLVKENRNFVKDRDTRYVLRFLGNGLLTNEGASWRHQRRMAQPAFHRERVSAYGKTMVSYAQRMLAGWKDGEPRDVHADMMRLTLEIVAECLFGKDVSAEETEAVAEALAEIMERSNEQGNNLLLRAIPDAVPTPSNLRLRAAVRRLDEVIHGIIGDRRRRREDGYEDGGDLLSMLLGARDEDGNPMGDPQLRDEVITVLTAGHETTAVSLSWTFRLLSDHPEVEARLLAELRDVLGRRPPTAGDLPRLRYTRMVVKESMRLYPPVWAVGREALQEFDLGGFRIPAGAQMILSQWVVHRDPRHFEEPSRFDPARWADGLEKLIPKYAYFPFGGGPRLCVGSSFAAMEAVLLMATTARRFRVEVSKHYVARPQPSITLRPKGGLPATL